MRNWLMVLVGAFVLAMASGCSMSPTGALTLFPEGHRMINSAKAVAQRSTPLELPRELQKEPLPSYVVEPGDVLLVQVVEEEEPVILPGDQPVIQDGTIDLGLFGRPIVAGRTLPEIEAIVAEAIAQRVKIREVTVRLISRQSKVFYVLGEVVTPGIYPLDGRETVLDGILLAGGLSDKANNKKIILSRPTGPCDCRVVLPVCYDEIVQLGDTATNYQLRPGDRIFVASRSILDIFRKKDDFCFPCNRPHSQCPISVQPCPPAGLPAGCIPVQAMPAMPEAAPLPDPLTPEETSLPDEIPEEIQASFLEKD